MVPIMDFRSIHCAWCAMRDSPLGACSPCPRYRKYHLAIDQALTMEAFCSVCHHNSGGELEVFCRTNRFLQEGSGEDFDCYRFRLAPHGHGT